MSFRSWVRQCEALCYVPSHHSTEIGWADFPSLRTLSREKIGPRDHLGDPTGGHPLASGVPGTRAGPMGGARESDSGW